MWNKLKFLNSQIRGYKTSRKIVVIESDDWGAERIPSKRVQQELENKGIDIKQNPHSRYDILEREDDFNALYEVLHKINQEFIDKKPVLTANFIMANPDFDRIKEARFQEYHYEQFSDTYAKKDRNNSTEKMLYDGIKNGFIKPQFHGREHINVLTWLDLLKKNNLDFRNAFDLNCYAIDSKTLDENKSNLMASYDYTMQEGKAFVDKSIVEGLSLFKNFFGYDSDTTVAPRYVWNNDIEDIFKKNGVNLMQTAVVQKKSTLGNYTDIWHHTGEKKNKMYFSVRNAHFEPAYNSKTDWIKQVMGKAKIAFLLRTPLIISTHRLNFVGGLCEKNRSSNLKQFHLLLSSLIKEYPNIEFMTSEGITKIMKNEFTVR
ncbi:hypothetical protein ACFQ3R_06220 [Mesonia ostreae]|uniref:Polysaccharide (De)acetylase n=1 Tax=Mesonia ostreae TaxID=861110 RepID=A0ABU2KH97_9FLAO|nr:hypothetical protein [Mesonia ostreae]MDT0294064.1 hypothetical protein [Mesonia ostreae]